MGMIAHVGELLNQVTESIKSNCFGPVQDCSRQSPGHLALSRELTAKNDARPTTYPASPPPCNSPRELEGAYRAAGKDWVTFESVVASFPFGFCDAVVHHQLSQWHTPPHRPRYRASR